MEPFVTDASVRRAADQGVSGGHSITVTFVATGAWLSWLELRLQRLRLRPARL